jgi:glycosyltransferase involved in cell wall biosynthesis
MKNSFYNIKKSKKLFYSKISKIFLFLFFLVKISIKYEVLNIYKIKRQIKLINQYYNLNNKGILINKKHFKRVVNPKVSIISAVYNNGKFILRFLRSIQNQFFADIEIIFIDDYSRDNSALIIEKNKKDDERIILLRNKKNKGTLISRNIGALKAKGEFLIFPDPDDMLSEDILSICYKISKRYNYDLIRFNMYSNRFFIFSFFDRNLKRIIYQPELRTYLIYGYGFKKLIDGIISNKFVRRTSFLIALNSINDYYLNKKMIYFEDGLINYALHLKAKSLYLLNHIGYYYIFNKKSVSHYVNTDLYFKCFFIFLKFITEKTKNNEYEKEINFFFVREYIPKNFLIEKISKYSKIYEEVINSLLNIKFINIINKNKLKSLQNIILKIKHRNIN